MEQNESEKFVAWFSDRLENKLSMTFGDVSDHFDCSFEYLDDDVFLHFSDKSAVVFQYVEQDQLYHPVNVAHGV